jgi:simple sugar transport system ATP-binding protein
MNTPVLEVQQISKFFPAVVANKDVNLKLQSGEILALLGENGAGKSTLMNIIYGLYQPSSGEILVRGKEVRMRSPQDAIGLGIGMVHQHFQLVPVMTVVENVMLGSESVRQGLLDRDMASQRVLDLSRDYQLEVDPCALVEDLPVGIQQRVEIIKALYRKAEILILDEPTAVLTPQEIEGLFEVMDLLRKQGKSIIFITHKLKEVLRIADRIAVLRQGELVGEVQPKEASETRLAAMMVGREVMLQVDKTDAKPGALILETHDLQAKNDLEETCLNQVNLNVHAGEIVGVAGVQGNGQTELVEVLTGLRPLEKGRIHIGGKDLTNATPRQITDQGGICHVPEDRHSFGMVTSYSVADNLILNSYYQPPFVNGVMIQRESIEENAESLIQKFDVRTPSAQTPVGSLSGGNQQKMIIAREISRPIQLMIAAQPTRGIDVGSIEFIHQQIVAKRDEGIAVLLVSSELDEIMALSDRIVVMYRGSIFGEVSSKDATRQKLGLLMAGVQPNSESIHESSH